MQGPGKFPLSPAIEAVLGVSVETLCARAGVTASNAYDTEDFFRLWAAADEMLDDPAAGLRFGAEGIARGYATPSIVGLHAPDLRQALATVGRYKRLTCPEALEVEVAGDEAAVRYRWLQATGAPPRLLIDVTMSALHAMIRRGSGGRVAPVRIELSRPAQDRELLSRHFGCPVVFGAAHDAMVFQRSALDTPFVTADGGAFGVVLQGLEARLASGEGFSGLIGDTRVAIARQLSEGRRPTVAAIARRMRLSARTLQRRLGDEGVSFQEQLSGVRRITASRLLANTQLDPVAIAMLLGFVEPNSFARAFRAWESTTPQRWRHDHAGAAA